MTTSTDLRAPAPVDDRAEAMALARVAYDRFADVVEQLGSDDWGRPTDCEGWTVRDLVGHVLGALRSAASMRELVSQQSAVLRRSRRTGELQVDAMTAIQIERTADLSTDELVAQVRQMARPAAEGRHKTPVLMRKAIRVPVQMGGLDEWWSLGYLVDTILTRDAWLHRVDLCRAVGAELVLTADEDGRIVEDVVAEWARRHGRPFVLTVTGPAGGAYRSDPSVDGEPEHLTVDAVDLCRAVSGRAPGEGLLATEVPF